MGESVCVQTNSHLLMKTYVHKYNHHQYLCLESQFHMIVNRYWQQVNCSEIVQFAEIDELWYMVL